MKKEIIKPKAIVAIVFSCVMGGVVSEPVLAVSNITYQTTINPEFTINDSISVSLSSSDLVISDLTPGQSSDSNEIAVNVATNNKIGYNLSATVGNNVDSNPSHNTTNLVHSNGNYTFTSLSTNDSLSTLTTPDTWGYSYATTTVDDSNGNTVWNWSNYSGLPLYTDTTRVATLSEKYVASNDTIGFKIAAYADSDQAAGEYTNKINFIAVAFPSPMTLSEAYAYFNKPQIGGYYTMQDMEPGICAVAEQLSTMQVIDTRDNNTYTITKLADNRCWMTTNLNLEGGTELSADDTDMDPNWTLPTANGFQTNNRLPASSTSGFSDDAIAFVYNSGNTTNCGSSGQNIPCYSYYSYIAATAGSGSSVIEDGTDASYSICPKNWRLPTSGNYEDTDPSSATGYKRGNFYKLATAYGINLENQQYEYSVTFYNDLGPTSSAKFLLSGCYWDSEFFYGGSSGYYWSSTGGTANTYAHILSFSPSSVSTASEYYRRHGFSVRCIANN